MAPSSVATSSSVSSSCPEGGGGSALEAAARLARERPELALDAVPAGDEGDREARQRDERRGEGAARCAQDDEHRQDPERGQQQRARAGAQGMAREASRAR